GGNNHVRRGRFRERARRDLVGAQFPDAVAEVLIQRLGFLHGLLDHGIIAVLCRPGAPLLWHYMPGCDDGCCCALGCACVPSACCGIASHAVLRMASCYSTHCNSVWPTALSACAIWFSAWARESSAAASSFSISALSWRSRSSSDCIFSMISGFGGGFGLNSASMLSMLAA